MCLIVPAKAQKVEMDKLEKAKKERTKVSLTTTTTTKRGLFSRPFSSLPASGASLHQLQLISTLRPSPDTRRDQRCQMQLSSGPAQCSCTAQPCPFVFFTGFPCSYGRSWLKNTRACLSLTANFAFAIDL